MSRKSLRQWLDDANGWRRIWFVCSIICVLYFVIIFPLAETNKGSSFRYQGLFATEKEMKNPNCATYMYEDFNKLVEPEYSTDGSTCYHIFQHRQYSDDKKPITETLYQEHFQSEEGQLWLKYIGIGFVISMLLIIFVYVVGVVTSWIIKGFKKNESQ